MDVKSLFHLISHLSSADNRRYNYHSGHTETSASHCEWLLVGRQWEHLD